MILTLCNCLEVSNQLLNTFHGETEPGQKQDLIQRCIDNNSKAIIAGLEYGTAVEKVLTGVEEHTEYLGQYFAIPVEVRDEIMQYLTECRELQPEDYISDKVSIIFTNLEKITALLSNVVDE